MNYFRSILYILSIFLVIFNLFTASDCHQAIKSRNCRITPRQCYGLDLNLPSKCVFMNLFESTSTMHIFEGYLPLIVSALVLITLIITSQGFRAYIMFNSEQQDYIINRSIHVSFGFQIPVRTVQDSDRTTPKSV